MTTTMALRTLILLLFTLLLALLPPAQPRPLAQAPAPAPAAAPGGGGRLADLLRFTNGTAVASAAAWAERREELKGLLGEHILGHPPDRVPALAGAREINATTSRGGVTSRFVELAFEDAGAPGQTAHAFVVEVLAPAEEKGGKPSPPARPLMLTQWNHRQWALVAVSRGYVACVYPGADTRDATPGFAAMYPDASWMLIMRRAWLASRVLDYAAGLDGVDAGRVAITGHSRNGKQSLIAAAFDERIGSVVGSSPGAPIASPALWSAPQYYGETVLYVAPYKRGWWVPGLKDFYGREDELPVDGHAVTALIAPRYVCVYSGDNDREGDIPFANERNHAAARGVFELLGAGRALRRRYRPGDHHGFLSVDEVVDFFDYSFSGGAAFAAAFPDAWRYGFDWAAWERRDRAARPPVPDGGPASAAARIRWALQLGEGGGPAYGFTPGNGFSEEAPVFDYRSQLLMRDNFAEAGVTRLPVAFGNQVTGNVYFPAPRAAAAAPPLPAVVWLHPFSYSSGPAPVYNGKEDMYHRLAAAGHVVLAFDQVGLGGRNVEGFEGFYQRYATSRLGRMVQDALAGAELLHCLDPARRGRGRCATGNLWSATYPDRLSALPAVDGARVYLAGYSMGGTVALHAAALDEGGLVAGVAALAGFSPLRADTADRRSGGLRRLSEWHALAPRLGLFVGNETAAPYDYCEDVLPLVAGARGRPTLLVTPTRDRDAPHDEVARCVQEAQGAWARAGAPGNLTWASPDAVNQITATERGLMVDWFRALKEKAEGVAE